MRRSESGTVVYLALASLTLMRGRARSSRRRWLCSVRRRSLSSDMDCLCGRAFIVCVHRKEANDEEEEEELVGDEDEAWPTADDGYENIQGGD